MDDRTAIPEANLLRKDSIGSVTGEVNLLRRDRRELRAALAQCERERSTALDALEREIDLHRKLVSSLEDTFGTADVIELALRFRKD